VKVVSGGQTGADRAVLDVALELGRPCLHLDLAARQPLEARTALERWLAVRLPARLNVAGPRAREDPAIYEAASGLLRRALAGAAALRSPPGSG